MAEVKRCEDDPAGYPNTASINPNTGALCHWVLMRLRFQPSHKEHFLLSERDTAAKAFPEVAPSMASNPHGPTSSHVPTQKPMNESFASGFPRTSEKIRLQEAIQEGLTRRSRLWVRNQDMHCGVQDSGCPGIQAAHHHIDAEGPPLGVNMCSPLAAYPENRKTC